MTRITGYLVAAVALVLVASVCLASSRLDRQIARAQQDLSTLQADDPEVAFAALERYVAFGSPLPWIGAATLNDVRWRKAASQYWQGQYDEVIPQQGDPIAAIPPDNIELQLTVANAVFRRGQAAAVDKPSVLRALDAGINAYLEVLKNTDRHAGAAYNYEYLVKLRDEIDSDRRPPILSDTGDQGPTGKQGGPKQDPESREFQILVPLDSDEMDLGIEPGQGGTIERQG